MVFHNDQIIVLMTCHEILHGSRWIISMW